MEDFDTAFANTNREVYGSGEFASLYPSAKEYAKDNGVSLDSAVVTVSPKTTMTKDGYPAIMFKIYPPARDGIVDYETAKEVAQNLANSINNSKNSNYIVIARKFTILASAAEDPVFNKEKGAYEVLAKYDVTGFYVDDKIEEDTKTYKHKVLCTKS